MNWRRGLIRLGIVLAVFVLLPLGFIGYVDWRISRELDAQRQELQIPDARVITRIPEARVISRSAIPTSPTLSGINWAVAAPRLALVMLVIGGAGWWAISGFRRT